MNEDEASERLEAGLREEGGVLEGECGQVGGAHGAEDCK